MISDTPIQHVMLPEVAGGGLMAIQTKPLYMRMTPQLARRVRRAARLAGCSIAEFVRRLIEKAAP